MAMISYYYGHVLLIIFLGYRQYEESSRMNTWNICETCWFYMKYNWTFYHADLLHVEISIRLLATTVPEDKINFNFDFKHIYFSSKSTRERHKHMATDTQVNRRPNSLCPRPNCWPMGLEIIRWTHIITQTYSQAT